MKEESSVLFPNTLNRNFHENSQFLITTIELASKLTDLIYDSFKLKSATSSFNRANVLKFINLTLQSYHNKDVEDCCIKLIKPSLPPSLNQEFLNKILNEHVIVNKFDKEVMFYYKRRDQIKRNASKRKEYMEIIDQKRLLNKFDCKVKRCPVFFETSDETIQSLLCIREENQHPPRLENRKHEIQLAYSLVDQYDSMKFSILKQMLESMCNSPEIFTYEISFLNYMLSLDLSKEIENILKNKCMFIFEKIILKYCSDVVVLTPGQVETFFNKLKDEKRFKSLVKFCKNDSIFLIAIKNMLFQLYYYSFCNSLILRIIYCL